MTLLIDDDELQIEYLPGNGRQLVVAFTGIGHGFGGMQKPEFVGTASADSTNHCVFVIDKKRTWFSTAGLRERIVRTVCDLRDRLDIDRVATIGNSMGGYGAILFSGPLGAQVAVGFSPQFSLSPDLVVDRRWPQFRSGVDLSNHPPLSEAIVRGCAYYAIFGADSPPDMQHANLLAATGEVRLHRIEGCGHELVGAIKQSGLLPELVSFLLDNRPNLVTVRLRRFEKMTQNAARQSQRNASQLRTGPAGQSATAVDRRMATDPSGQKS